MANKKPAKQKPSFADAPSNVSDKPPGEVALIEAPGGSHFHATREVIESVAVAFVLAFLFRTFVAEAFVIPTGSMAPALEGRHKDVDCAMCGYRFRVTASDEDPENRPAGSRADLTMAQTVGGMCPMCRYLMPFRPDLPESTLEEAGVAADEVEFQPSYPGDRIVVSKFGLDFADPERWDVVVFKFPGDGNMNYIKRLTGLPGDSLRIYQGDLFVKSPDATEFEIARRPADKLVAMLQPVHDTRYEPSELYDAGWPLRWAPTTPDGWQHAVDADEQDVVQTFAIDGTGDETAWIRYRHLVPDQDDWRVAQLADRGELTAEERAEWESSQRPQLISDFNPYNARLQRNSVERFPRHGWQLAPSSVRGESTGYCWVGDLALECDVNVLEPRGELLLDLVKAGFHFRATIDLETGAVLCSIVDGRTGETLDFEASGQTSLDAAGDYELRFANIDDQLWLWVDGDRVDLAGAAYDPDTLLGGRKEMLPWASPDDAGDQGDLAPAGVGARGAALIVDRLAVLRDIYYVAAKYGEDAEQFLRTHRSSDPDYPANPNDDYPTGPVRDANGQRVPAYKGVKNLLTNPEDWGRFWHRRQVEFEVGDDQFFVMGDNSPESSDARVWTDRDNERGGRGLPGGNYVDRRLLIGRAVAVFWPHSWGSIPGMPWLPGFPNFGDMRLVR
ncbi:MAG: signal peptidase I [Planctomycetales bacterium]|nr:signal peptidase I [Planctomycetales bacterium]